MRNGERIETKLESIAEEANQSDIAQTGVWPLNKPAGETGKHYKNCTLGCGRIGHRKPFRLPRRNQKHRLLVYQLRLFPIMKNLS